MHLDFPWGTDLDKEEKELRERCEKYYKNAKLTWGIEDDEDD